MVEYGPFEPIDPTTLDEPWLTVVWHWLHHHLSRMFLPELEDPCRYLLTWDDLRDILVAGGFVDSNLTVH